MKVVILAGLTALIMGSTMTHQLHAQPASVPAQTTRILAIGTLEPGVDLWAVRAILPTEIKETVKLYLDERVVGDCGAVAIASTSRSARRWEGNNSCDLNP